MTVQVYEKNYIIRKINRFGRFDFRTGYFETQCFKSLVLNGLEPVNLNDNKVVEKF